MVYTLFGAARILCAQNRRDCTDRIAIREDMLIQRVEEMCETTTLFQNSG